jgi:hypothetical protein
MCKTSADLHLVVPRLSCRVLNCHTICHPVLVQNNHFLSPPMYYKSTYNIVCLYDAREMPSQNPLVAQSTARTTCIAPDILDQCQLATLLYMLQNRPNGPTTSVCALLWTYFIAELVCVVNLK